ncbi:hypothetical protein F52700_2870 [Fusarium sp. NRRL 52700]|nr:hypothetical protein F52700_2870 [Fusarium sp. NRRL 52700]
MSIAFAVISALEGYEYDPNQDFARLRPGESPCLGSQVDFETTADRVLTPLQRWRIVQCLNELGSSLRSLVLTNLCGTISDNPVGVAPALQLREFVSVRGYLSLIYRAQTDGEQHDAEEILSRVNPGYARECVEVDVSTGAVDGLLLAFRDLLDNETPRKKVDRPDKLPVGFLAAMQRCVDAGYPKDPKS